MSAGARPDLRGFYSAETLWQMVPRGLSSVNNHIVLSESLSPEGVASEFRIAVQCTAKVPYIYFDPVTSDIYVSGILLV